MKYILILLFISSTASAQEYKDSTISLLLTQRTAWWVTKAISINAETRKLPDALAPFVGSGTRPDSFFTVTLKAGLIRDGLELLLTRPLLLSLSDYNSIILNTPAIPGYTSLANQIVARANGNSNEKQVAIWLRDWYTGRVAAFTNLYNEEKAAVIRLVQ
jgi:hypothetical protein